MNTSSKFLVGVQLLSCCLQQAAWAETVPAVRGRVQLEGPIPQQEWVTIEPKTGVHSTEGCGSMQKISQKLQIDPSGGIKNAVVWVEFPSETTPGESKGSAFLDQRECVFVPHVLALQSGGELVIRNSDSVIHNIRIFRKGRPDMLMHRWQKKDASDVRWRFQEPGPYVVRCGVHPWMYAWILVLPNSPHAVTDDQGQFSLEGVPPGQYSLHVWHETLGEREVPVEVKRGPGKELEPIRFRARG